MTRYRTRFTLKSRHHNKWLVLIAAYKFAQAILFLLIGLGARHLLHKDVGDELGALADHLRFNPESKFINFILDKASLLNDPLFRRIGLVAFSYSALSMAEGIGLYREKAWGEYLTLAITASFLPWEIYEIFLRQTPIRFGLLAVNLMVFLYLLKMVVENMGHRKSGRK